MEKNISIVKCDNDFISYKGFTIRSFEISDFAGNYATLVKSLLSYSIEKFVSEIEKYHKKNDLLIINFANHIIFNKFYFAD